MNSHLKNEWLRECYSKCSQITILEPKAWCEETSYNIKISRKIEIRFTAVSRLKQVDFGMQNWRTFEEMAALAARAFRVNKVVLPVKWNRFHISCIFHCCMRLYASLFLKIETFLGHFIIFCQRFLSFNRAHSTPTPISSQLVYDACQQKRERGFFDFDRQNFENCAILTLFT